MLFDPSLDVLSGVNDLANLTRYFSDFPPESTEQKWLSMSTQPVLEASYQFFLVVADVTKLARIARPLNESETRTLIYLQKNILRWEEDTCGDPGKMLYVLAMRILLLKVDLALPNVNVTEEMQRLLQQGLDIIRSLDVRKFLLGYLLWPLAVLGTITVDDNDRNIVENKISLLAQTRHGQAVRAQRRLEAIWASRDGDKETTMLGRLRMLVEGI
ncbi:hypothetical protein PHISCL_02705 [Aspergillus sclerotialis]|uniref:Uncharacterized protein n=1 Tax=Aspergillus sclerotialis TaxID=2070753 RepID=A0A3A3A6F4_9EURO|nr:hypothetical protein PHISCL_02705 [Aspergillus sclerotialis]